MQTPNTPVLMTTNFSDLRGGELHACAWLQNEFDHPGDWVCSNATMIGVQITRVAISAASETETSQASSFRTIHLRHSDPPPRGHPRVVAQCC